MMESGANDDYRVLASMKSIIEIYLIEYGSEKFNRQNQVLI